MKTLKWQFGLGAILFATFCVAGFFSGYRCGGEAKSRQLAASTVSVVNYDVREFLDSKNSQPIDAQLNQICKLVVETVDPSSWQGDGRDIVPFPANSSIVVRQTGSCHAAIADLFEQLRRLRKRT